MASLNVIMNSDEDHQDRPRSDKKEEHPGTPAPGTCCHDPSFNSPSSSHVIRSGQPDIDKKPNPPPPQGKPRFAVSSRALKASEATSASSRTSAARRQSTTSNDSMDQSGYASGASSSSIGGSGRGINPNQPRRPMPNQTLGEDTRVKLTPITGRVSRAKKGVPVHTCDMCKKTFTRAEHLRRHQLSHNTPAFSCTYSGCDRTFFRADLLQRHLQKHEQGGVPRHADGTSTDRRDSSASASAPPEESFSRLGLQQPGAFVPPGSDLGGFPASSTSATSAGMGAMSGFQQNPYPQASNPENGAVPGMTNSGGNEYGPPPGGRDSQAYSSYALSSSMTGLQPPVEPLGVTTCPPQFNTVDYQPRSAPPTPLFVVTQNLSSGPIPVGEGPPELYHSQEASPWTSASDSTYSTPSEMSRNPQYWMSRHRSPTAAEWQTNNMLSPYPSSAQRELHSPGGGYDALAAPYYPNALPPSPRMASPQYHHPYGNLLDVPMAGGFHDEGAQPLMDATSQAIHRHPTSSVRSPTPPLSIATSTQSAEALVTAPLVLPNRMGMLAGLGRQKEMAMGGFNATGAGVFGMSGQQGWGSPSSGSFQGMPGGGTGRGGGCVASVTIAFPLGRTVRNAVPRYLNVYWERFHDLYPFVHRHTVETAGEDVLRCAMAAVGTQFLDNMEDRACGNQLHEFAWQEAKRYPQWNHQIMQAILLCELFSHFRGRKALIRPSKLFESLYSRVREQDHTIFSPASPARQDLSREERWRAWLDAECRRRLLAACFVVDSHTSVYYEQPRARHFDPGMPGVPPAIPLTTSSSALWSAGSADEWAALLDTDPATGAPRFLPSPEELTPEGVQALTRFDQMVVLAAEALRLSHRRRNPPSIDSMAMSGMASLGEGLMPDGRHTRSDRGGAAMDPAVSPASVEARQVEEHIVQLFPDDPIANTYLALHHTPLRDLLSVSGESWLFSQKIVHQATFQEHQRRFKQWAEGYLHAAAAAARGPAVPPGPGGDGMSVARATIYAARALTLFLARPRLHRPATPSCVSDYWAMYVCALICWAFAQRAPRADARGGGGRNADGAGAGAGGGRSAAERESAGLAWLRAAGEVPPSRPEEVLRVRGRREAGAAVGLVRRRLEAECLGGRSKLVIDAVGVLRKLEEGMVVARR